MVPFAPPVQGRLCYPQLPAHWLHILVFGFACTSLAYEIPSFGVSTGVRPSAMTWVPSSGPAKMTGQRPRLHSDEGTDLHSGETVAQVWVCCGGSRLSRCPRPRDSSSPELQGGCAGQSSPRDLRCPLGQGKQPGWQVWVVSREDAEGPSGTSSGLQQEGGCRAGWDCVLLLPSRSFLMSWFLCWCPAAAVTHEGMAGAAGGGGFVREICGGCLVSGLARGSALEWLFR